MAMNPNRDFAGKVAFVTGAASGIGRASALAFAREGASVTAADVSEQGNQETVRLIEEQGGRARAVRCDVTRVEDVKAALDKTVEAFGRLDFAFNNAGIEPSRPAPTAEYAEEEWNRRIIDTNLRGVFLCMKHEIPLILKQGGGAIVNASSGTGVIGIKGSPAYTAAKHGVIGLTRAAALDYAAQNIRGRVASRATSRQTRAAGPLAQATAGATATTRKHSRAQLCRGEGSGHAGGGRHAHADWLDRHRVISRPRSTGSTGAGTTWRNAARSRPSGRARERPSGAARRELIPLRASLARPPVSPCIALTGVRCVVGARSQWTRRRARCRRAQTPGRRRTVVCRRRRDINVRAM